MASYKTSVKEIFSDDPESLFWRRVQAGSEYKTFEKDLEYIIEESIKHGMPYYQIPKHQVSKSNERTNS